MIIALSILSAVAIIGFVLSLIFNAQAKNELKERIEGYQQELHRVRNRNITLTERNIDLMNELETGWLPKWMHTSEKRSFFPAAGISQDRADDIKSKAVELFARFIKTDSPVSMILETALTMPGYTPFECIVLFEEFMMLYRIASMSTTYMMEVKNHLAELGDAQNPTHDLSKYMNKEKANRRIVNGPGSLLSVIEEIIGKAIPPDMLNRKQDPGPGAPISGDKEPEEQIHAKAEEAEVDAESQVSNL